MGTKHSGSSRGKVTSGNVTVTVLRSILSMKGRWWKGCSKKGFVQVSVDKMQFFLIPNRGTIDAIFILRRMQEEYHAKGKKLYVLWTKRKLLTEYQRKCWNRQ